MSAAVSRKQLSPPRRSAPSPAVARRASRTDEETDAEYAARHPIETAIEAKKKSEGRIGDTDEETLAVMDERRANCRPQDLIPVTENFIERLRKPWPKR